MRQQEGNRHHTWKHFGPGPGFRSPQARTEEPEKCEAPPPPRRTLPLTRPLFFSSVCRPVLNQYIHTREEFHHYTAELFKLQASGALKLSVFGEYPLTTEGIKQTQVDLSPSLSHFWKCLMPD